MNEFCGEWINAERTNLVNEYTYLLLWMYEFGEILSRWINEIGEWIDDWMNWMNECEAKKLMTTCKRNIEIT